MKTKVLNLDNKAAGDVELNDAIFGLEPRADLIQRVVVWQLAKRRSGQHKVLTRAEVNRTKKKIYKQKGTGQARHGARSAPLFVGGAKAMGPVAHSHEFDLPKKVKALGLRHALSSKAKDGAHRRARRSQSRRISRPARWPSSSASSRSAAPWWWMASSTRTSSCRPAISPHVALLPVAGINVYDIMRSDQLVLTTAAVKAIEARLGEASGHEHQLRRHPLAGDHRKGHPHDRSQPGRVPRRLGRHQAGHRQGRCRPVQGQGQGGEHGRREGQAQAVRGKRYTRSDFKKAIVTLEEGHQIDITTGL